jgi:hypothetical protein
MMLSRLRFGAQTGYNRGTNVGSKIIFEQFNRTVIILPPRNSFRHDLV